MANGAPAEDAHRMAKAPASWNARDDPARSAEDRDLFKKVIIKINHKEFPSFYKILVQNYEVYECGDRPGYLG